jgi:subtilisin family serine protease
MVGVYQQTIARSSELADAHPDAGGEHTMGGRDPHGYGLPVVIGGKLEIPARMPSQQTVHVGVVDTGISNVFLGQPHSFLQDRLEEGYDVEPEGEDGHGSFIAGVVLHRAPTAMVHMKRAITDEQSVTEDENVAAAITALGRSVDLINLSFSGSVSEDDTPEVIKTAIDKLPERVVVVGAAANTPSPLPTFPAAHERVIAVGASTSDGQIAEFTRYGKWVDVYAPGVKVTGPHGVDFAEWSGTSIAAAVVTGIIAQRMSFGISALKAKEQLLSGPQLGVVYDVNGPRRVKMVF